MKVRATSRDCQSDRLAPRVVALEEKLAAAMERVATLEEDNARLPEENRQLGEENQHLKQQWAAARKVSSTSCKLPSSNIVQPKKPPTKRGKSGPKGGQPGHPQHLQSAFPPEAVNHFEPHTRDRCPDCGGSLVLGRREPEVLQQVEIIETPTLVMEHQGLAYCCPHCRKVHYAPTPEPVVKAGLLGPRWTAPVAFMKGACHGLFSTIGKFLRHVLRVNVSRGYLAKLIAKVSESLAGAYAELFQRLPCETVLNIDQTGHKEIGQKSWSWCFRAQMYTLFRVDKSRGWEVLVEVLGEKFNGVRGCDYFRAYRTYMRKCDVLVQFCMTHLIRHVTFLPTRPGRHNQAYGQPVRDALRELFALIHRRDKMTATGFPKAFEAAREQVVKAR